jgi:hypothetical protein
VSLSLQFSLASQFFTSAATASTKNGCSNRSSSVYNSNTQYRLKGRTLHRTARTIHTLQGIQQYQHRWSYHQNPQNSGLLVIVGEERKSPVRCQGVGIGRGRWKPCRDFSKERLWSCPQIQWMEVLERERNKKNMVGKKKELWLRPIRDRMMVLYGVRRSGFCARA